MVRSAAAVHVVRGGEVGRPMPLGTRHRGGDRSAARLPEAVVLGDLDLVRPLYLAGIPCRVVAPPGKPPNYSRMARPVGWADPWKHPDALLDLLLRTAEQLPERPVLFYQLDAYTSFISRHREVLAQTYRFVLPDAELIEDCLDKSRFLALGEKLGLPMPESRVLLPADAAPAELGVSYPLVIKPAVHGNRGWSTVATKQKAVRVDSPSALTKLWPHLVARGEDILVQELVPGPETRIESYHAYRTSEGVLAGEFTGRKLRTHPVEYGHTTALVVTNIPDVRELGRDVVRRLALSGVVKIDFKRAPDGRLVLLEANPRFNLWHHPAAYTGVNLPARVWSDVTGLRAPRSMPTRAEACWMSPRDVQAAREWGVPLMQWIVWAWRCEAKSLGGLGDPGPLLSMGADRARGVLTRR